MDFASMHRICLDTQRNLHGITYFAWMHTVSILVVALTFFYVFSPPSSILLTKNGFTYSDVPSDFYHLHVGYKKNCQETNAHFLKLFGEFIKIQNHITNILLQLLYCIQNKVAKAKVVIYKGYSFIIHSMKRGGIF